MALGADQRNDLEPWIADEIEIVINGFAGCEDEDKRADIDFVREGRGLGYMFAVGQLLVREQYVNEVLAILGEVPDERQFRQSQPDRIRRIIPGVVLLTLARPSRTIEQFYIPNLLERIDRELGQGVATPDHVLTVAGDAGTCPATEPEQVYNKTEPYPSVCHDGGGDGVLIYMADTGLLPDPERGHPWLAGVRMGDVTKDQDSGYGKRPIPPYTAHGTFVAGVARCMAPEAEIIVTNAFAVAGSTLESDLVPRLVQALGYGVDIFNLTVAAPSRARSATHHVRGMARAAAPVQGRGVPGRGGQQRHQAPTLARRVPRGDRGRRAGRGLARPRLVQQLRRLGRCVRAGPGSGQRLYARPLRVPRSTRTRTRYAEFYGMAKWNGTSFSTPIVTGLIASRMSRTGENAQQAAAALLAQAQAQAIPGVGAVLLPECPGDRRRGQPCGCGAAHRPGHCGCGCG